MNDLIALFGDLAYRAHERGAFAEAEAVLKMIVGRNNDEAQVLYLLGHMQYQRGRFAEAAVALDMAVSINPNHAAAHNDLAAALFALGQDEIATLSIRRALAIRPDFAEALETNAIMLLRAGRFREAWPQFEARFRSLLGRHLDRGFAQPQWRGEDITGCIILLHAEQGHGDALQFVRYVPLVAARGATVLVETLPGQGALLHGLAGASAILERGDALPPFDLHCPMMSLPLAFDTDLGSIPTAVPYLAPPPDRVADWRARLGEPGGLRVGVAFSGNPAHRDDHRRSLALAQFARLLRGRACSFHLLQTEIRPADRTATAGLALQDHSAGLHDFADTAALAALMDLVITVDTALTHLAGALAVPVWVLLAFRADWRWLERRGDSPWYPTMRLFRQSAPGDWNGVLDQVARALDAFRPC